MYCTVPSNISDLSTIQTYRHTVYTVQYPVMYLIFQPFRHIDILYILYSVQYPVMYLIFQPRMKILIRLELDLWIQKINADPDPLPFSEHFKAQY